GRRTRTSTRRGRRAEEAWGAPGARGSRRRTPWLRPRSRAGPRAARDRSRRSAAWSWSLPLVPHPADGPIGAGDGARQRRPAARGLRVDALEPPGPAVLDDRERVAHARREHSLSAGEAVDRARHQGRAPLPLEFLEQQPN